MEELGKVPQMHGEPCESTSVYCPWPRPELLTWSRNRRQRDYLYSFCRLADGASCAGESARSFGRKRPIRIVASRRGLERLSVLESTYRRIVSIPPEWRIAVGLIVTLSALEIFVALHSGRAEVSQQAAGSIAPNAVLMQDRLPSPPMIAPAG